MTNKISRSQWNQIISRVRKADFTFDPEWKCLIDGLRFDICLEHSAEDNEQIIEQVKNKI